MSDNTRTHKGHVYLGHPRWPWREWDWWKRKRTVHVQGGGGGGGNDLVLFTQISTSTAKKQKQNEYAVTVGITWSYARNSALARDLTPRKTEREEKKGEGRWRKTGILHSTTTWIHTGTGKIQGDGRKFLARFKSYFGSQISSQSLNEVRIYRLQPKSATKGDFFHIFLSLIVSSRRHGLQMANEANEVLLGKRPR